MSIRDIRPLYSAKSIAQRVGELSRQIDEELAHRDPMIISLLSGSVVFVSDLVRAIPTPLRFEFIRVQYSPRAPGDQLDIYYPFPIDVADQTVILIKDVIGSGVTESYLRTQFQNRGAADVFFGCLVDLPEDRKTSFEVDYPAFTARRAGRMVGYGLRWEGRFGSLPYVALLGDDGDAE